LSQHLNALLLSDGKPGHQRQAEGVLAAIARLRPVATTCLKVRRRLLIPTRALLRCVNLGLPPAAVLRLGYGIDASTLPRADIVVSAGGETLAANAAAARLLSAPNLFSGRLRGLAPERVEVILVSLDRLATHANHLVCLPPSPIDLGWEGRAPAARLGRSNPPRSVGVLIGGNSGSFRYRPVDWQRLTCFLRKAHGTAAIDWLVTTSRRSQAAITDTLATLAGDVSSGIRIFIDYRAPGSQTLRDIYSAADAILCTDDSTSMISEAVGSGLPIVAVRPAAGRLAPQEREYRDLLAGRGWYRALPLSELSPDAFLAALEEITPPARSPLDALAEAIARRLPQLFTAPG
jgi:mitochondrial fission protein ELM1